jgi:hypothetical protein
VVLNRGEDNVESVLSRRESSRAESTTAPVPPTGTPRPAAESLNAAGRSNSSESGVPSGEQKKRDPLLEEVERLRKRVNQQEESIVRMAAGLRALRRAGQALRAENRELRLAVHQSETAAEERVFL